ncbi:YheC/YheD family protein [Pseudalkalibacillus sp. SCS-8]|uniref:YheC/YheD family endospore coat-associated protein n=1 Tax=Pseudalkalibacillus nanhaiensis TaxID=3115291 RepID=UPI0032DA7C53
MKQWHHHEKNQTYKWGRSNQPIPYSAEKSNMPFSISVLPGDKNNVGPVIGILTSTRKGLPFIGNMETFTRLIRYVHERAGFAYVFCPQNDTSVMNGFTYDYKRDCWFAIKAPLPDVVYNRIPSPEMEATREYAQMIERLESEGIPFFNRSFFSKWDVYLLLNDNPLIKSFLPETRLISSPYMLKDLLKDFNRIIIKPILSSKGSGVTLLEQNEQHTINAFSNKQQNTFNHVYEAWHALALKPYSFIIQPYVSRKAYKSKPFDYRILVQKVKESWSVTGYGIRCSGPDMLTTHVPSGGSLLSPQIAPLDENRLDVIAHEIGTTVDEALGPVSEFSIDLGVDDDNQYWIFEVNSKPMVFDEDHIRIEAEKRWFLHVLEISGYTSQDINPFPFTHTIQ